MGRLCRAREWAETPLGRAEEWPASLRTAVALVLGSGFPMILVWGPELVQIYNDAYVPLIGDKHPAALGMPTHQCWPEIRHLQEPIFERVFRGETVSLAEAYYPLNRRGVVEDCYFDATFVPVPLEMGEIGGSASTLFEVTARVEARRLEAERETFRLVIEHSNDAYGLFDFEGRLLWANRLLGERLGYTLAELRELSIPEVSPQVSLARHQALFERARRERIPPFEAWHRRKDGSTFPVEITATAVEFPQGTRLSVAVRDITERKQAEASLRESEEKYRTLFDSIDAGFCVIQMLFDGTDRPVDYRFLEANAAFAEQTGLEDAVGRTARELLPDLEEHWFAIYGRVAQTGEPIRFQSGSDPMGRWFDVYAFRSGVPEERQVALLFTDVTAAHAAERERERLLAESERAREDAEAARQEAERANRAKSEFLAVMSHELRTPLNAISGYTELLEMGIHGPVTEAQRKALARIQASQQHLLGLINDVLNYAKLETGSVRYDIGEVRVRDVLAAVEALVEPQAYAKRLALRIGECPPELRVGADPEKLRQILVNLLSNAIKFTDAGGRVSLACEPRGEYVHLAVRDTGIGIPADKLDTIFEPFVQVRSDLTRSAEGTGLGLAISRDLARGMDGDLMVESKPGEGSAFTLTLPRA